MDWMRRFFMPLRDLSAKYSVMQSAMASTERIFQLLDTEPAVRDSTASSPPRQPDRLEHPASGAEGAARSEPKASEVNRSAAAQQPNRPQADSRSEPKASEVNRFAAAQQPNRPQADSRSEPPPSPPRQGDRLEHRPAPAERARAASEASEVNRRGAVEFQNVWFAYQGEEWVLRDVSFRVAAGERVALVGATGAGKTSVIKLLTRLYEVTRGRILLDGVDLRDIPQRELRRRVAMVLQDVFLFSGSVASNIALGREDLAPGVVERAARAVEAHRFIERLPAGYETELRERGSDLSAGQRQLLSFARALAHGGDVLVLDEATSSVDPETELLVQRGLRALMERRSAIVIAHRLSTIQDVDRIYVLHRGRLVEAGGHAELLARRGAYWRLYRLQFEAADSARAAS
jgi:ABC-type multidrug transport system fused ATPase/permease subunit